MTFEQLLHSALRCPRRRSMWQLEDLLKALESFALHHRDDPEMLHAALECRIAIKSLQEPSGGRGR